MGAYWFRLGSRGSGGMQRTSVGLFNHSGTQITAKREDEAEMLLAA